MSSFVHLHVHSDYSPMEGVSSVQALCEAARTQGADTLALTAWKKESADDLYVELTAGPGMHEALAFSRRAEIPPVATNHVRFVNRGDFDVHRLLRAIALNTTLSRLPEDACCSPSHWLM